MLPAAESSVTLWAIAVPTVGSVAVAIIGAIVAISGRERNRRTQELGEAFQQRGMLVDALRDRVLNLETSEELCRRDLTDVRRRLTALETSARRRSKPSTPGFKSG